MFYSFTKSVSLVCQKLSVAMTAINITVFLGVTPCSLADVQRNMLPLSSCWYLSCKLYDVISQTK
jgi:hypothetical protein